MFELVVDIYIYIPGDGRGEVGNGEVRPTRGGDRRFTEIYSAAHARK